MAPQDLPAVAVNVPETSGTFDPFSRLAPELQIKIWQLVATTQPRTITVYHHRGGAIFHRYPQKCDGQTQVPAILHVSHQARTEGLKYYIRCLEKPLDEAQWSIYLRGRKGAYPGRKLIYINPAVDRFLFEHQPNRESFMSPEYLDGFPEGLPLDKFNLEPEVISTCKHLIVRADFNWMEYAVERVRNLLAVRELKTMIMIIEDTWARSIGEKGLEEIDFKEMIEKERKGIQLNFEWMPKETEAASSLMTMEDLDEQIHFIEQTLKS
ncbi:hypothetical protein BDZ45DRAFT_746643 [Acephala macrosclerotiorum]|nr:hypothetical protein BDZ45DRAFT_746643 [Acephala macrosclerotiorum]